MSIIAVRYILGCGRVPHMVGSFNIGKTFILTKLFTLYEGQAIDRISDFFKLSEIVSSYWYNPD